MNGDNMNKVRCEASRYFRNKKREYLKDKINELARIRRGRGVLYNIHIQFGVPMKLVRLINVFK
jgi:hypothetical protein